MDDYNEQAHVSELVFLERQRQKRLKEQGKFPFTPDEDGASDDYCLRVLVEEVGEVAKSLQEDPDSTIDELIQVAAVAMAWAERLSR